MVEILNILIEAERAGNWDLHLQSIRLMLPYLHVAVHSPYAKYLHQYLQEMHELEQEMDILDFKKFTNLGYFTI